jgi:hypothetical protein
MTHHTVRGLGTKGLVLLLSVALAPTLRGQDPRDAQVARAFNEFDAARRLQLLMSALNPTSGPPRGAWPVGVQLLAQTLIEDGQDSVAAVWLRWAVRLSPDLQPDTVQFLPKVVSAYRAARDFVNATRAPGDTEAATTWLWPSQTGEKVGHLQIAASAVTVPVKLDVRGVGPIGAGGSVPLSPGSYQITASAPGYDSVRVTREVMPGVTTVLDFRLRSALAQVAPKPQPTPAKAPPPAPVAAQQKKGGFPVVWVVAGVAAVGVAVAVLAGGKSNPPTSGGLTVTIPNP